jgi:sarcosine oxidase
MTVTADVVVVGLGAVGSATLHRLALQGVSVIGIDRFDPPHNLGSTHGETRITRLAVAEGDVYVPLVRRSHALWRELEAQTGETLMVQTGGLIIGEGGGQPSHGQDAFLGSTIAIAQAHGIAYDMLDSAEIRRRYPQFLVRDAEHGFFEPTAGILFPERAVAIQLRLARELGAVVRPNEQVLGIERCGSGAAVVTDRGRIEAGRVILTAGAWLPGLAGGKWQDLAAIHRQTLLWFEADEPALYDPARCPIFIWMYGATPEDYLYGFPILEKGGGVKAATEHYGPASIDPDTVERDVPDSEWQGIYDRHLAGRLRGVSNRLIKAATCLYTVTPDAGFVIDSLQANGAVIVASACSGHGFKHSPALGEYLAARAVEATPVHEAAFALGRFSTV